MAKHRHFYTLIAFAFVSHFGKVSAFDGKSATVKDPNNQKVFSTINSMECGGRHISLVQNCIIVTEGGIYTDRPGGFCYSENIYFMDVGKKNVNSVSYSHQWGKGAFEHSVNHMACMNALNKKFVVVESSSAGNCKSCEWSDVFSTEGKYLGTSQHPPEEGVAWDLPHFLQLPQDLYVTLFEGENTKTEAEVDVGPESIEKLYPELHKK